MGRRWVSDDQIASVDDHVERILSAIEPLGDFPQPLMETLGLASAEDVLERLDEKLSLADELVWA